MEQPTLKATHHGQIGKLVRSLEAQGLALRAAASRRADVVVCDFVQLDGTDECVVLAYNANAYTDREWNHWSMKRPHAREVVDNGGTKGLRGLTWRKDWLSAVSALEVHATACGVAAKQRKKLLRRAAAGAGGPTLQQADGTGEAAPAAPTPATSASGAGASDSGASPAARALPGACAAGVPVPVHGNDSPVAALTPAQGPVPTALAMVPVPTAVVPSAEAQRSAALEAQLEQVGTMLAEARHKLALEVQHSSAKDAQLKAKDAEIKVLRDSQTALLAAVAAVAAAAGSNAPAAAA